jgi:hypothetical protein
MPDHGRTIPLSDEAHIEAYAGYEIDPDLSLVDYEKDDIDFLRNEKGIERVEALGSRQAKLGVLKARRFVVRFAEKGTTMIEDEIIALGEGVEYDLNLVTPESRYEKDKRDFEKVAMSWRLIPRVW